MDGTAIFEQSIADFHRLRTSLLNEHRIPSQWRTYPPPPFPLEPGEVMLTFATGAAGSIAYLPAWPELEVSLPVHTYVSSHRLYLVAPDRVLDIRYSDLIHFITHHVGDYAHMNKVEMTWQSGHLTLVSPVASVVGVLGHWYVHGDDALRLRTDAPARSIDDEIRMITG